MSAEKAPCEPGDVRRNCHGEKVIRGWDEPAGDVGIGELEHVAENARPKPVPSLVRDDEERMPGPREYKVIKNSSRGGQRPEVRNVRVLGNERLTTGGKVKKSKPKQKSVKKRQAD